MTDPIHEALEQQHVSDAWDALRAECLDFEAWYSISMTVNAWIGVDTNLGGFYGGCHIDGDAIDWDDDDYERWTASGDTIEGCIADLIGRMRKYRADR